MRFHTTTLLLALPLSLGGAASCGTETVEPDVLFLTDSNAPAATAETWLDVIFQPNTSVADGAQYSVRVDGRRVLMSPEDPTPWRVNPGVHASKRSDNLAGGHHVVELLTPSGQVALTTSPLTFTPGRGNQIVVYGNASALRYDFFDNPTAESDAVPAGSLLVRVLNIRNDGKSVDLMSCPLTATSALDCTAATSGLAYGQIWEQVLAHGTSVGVVCNPASSADLCFGVTLTQKCYDASFTFVEPKVETIIVSQANGYFDLYDLGGLQTCTYQ